MKKLNYTNRVGAIAMAIVVTGMAAPPALASHNKKITTSLERSQIAKFAKSKPKKLKIRTTAYTHTESDHIEYGKKSAAGTTLRHGSVNSAAADWSRFPLGTKFKISGSEVVYEIDDYGSALVGKDVIDLYQPTRSAMNKWGAREVDIEILEWGCAGLSLEIMKPRARKARHVRKMVEALENRDRDDGSADA